MVLSAALAPLIVTPCSAAATVQVERLNPALADWKFQTIPKPSFDDLGNKATIALAGGTLHGSSGNVQSLLNGRVSSTGGATSPQTLFFSNGAGGRFHIDLGSAQPVSAVASYSWHEYAADQGARAPQVYTLYGSAAAAPDTANPATWTEIADVDTRPNSTGTGWNGQHGAYVSDPSGTLGTFRHLLLVVSPTGSPLEPGHPEWTETFFTEIDVHGPGTLALPGVSVAVEQRRPADGTWAFTSVPRPSKSDVATGATFQISGNTLDGAGAPGAGTLNGRLPSESNDLTQLSFLTNANATGGSFLYDLGSVQPVTAINSYSWHEFGADQGSRAPQVYALYGSAATSPDPADPTAWTKLTEVDTRPNMSGTAWNGQHAASVTAGSGTLGNFRHVMMKVQPTLSPLQGNAVYTNTMFAEVDVHTSATQPLAGDATIIAPVAVTDVWIVFKTHFDLGFTDLASNVFNKYRTTMMDGALSVIDDNRTQPAGSRFVWTVPGWPSDRQILGPLQTEPRRSRIDQAFAEGSMAVHALPGSTHTESLELEDLVRGFRFSSNIARSHGRPLPVAAKMTDVPEHSWVMPTLLKNAGVKFLHIGCNPACQYPRFPQLFWWEGPDGSRVLCGYTIDYGNGVNKPAGWRSRHLLAMIMTGDNHGPPTAAEVATLKQQAATANPGATIHLGTLDDFANAVTAENPDLDVVKADTPDTWIHGTMSMPVETKTARNVRPLAPALDALDTRLRTLGLITQPVAGPLADAYEKSFLYGEHTWGMNAEYGPRTLYGSAWTTWLAQAAAEPEPAGGNYAALPNGSKKKWLRSYEDHKDYIRGASTIIRTELDARLATLASSVATSGDRLVVWNPLPWTRSGIVAVPDQPGKFLLAENIPGQGYQTFDPADAVTETAATVPPGNVLDTPYFTATFDLARGGISSLVDKTTGRQLVDATSPYVVGQFQHERFSRNEVYTRFYNNYSRHGLGGWAENDIAKPGMPDATASPYWSATPPNWAISARSSALADTVVLACTDTLGLAAGYMLTFTFPRHEALLDVEWAVNGKTANKIPEGGWLCFPFAAANPQFTVGRPGGPINPATGIVPGANRHLLGVASGVAINGDNGAGVAVCPLDSPLISLEKPGLWWWSMDFVPAKPTVFVNLYNNMWNTNFPLWQDGSWSERVRVWPLAGGTTPAAELNERSWEARLPLLAARATGPAGALPARAPGLSLSRRGALVTAFGTDSDGVVPGTLLRVWEQSGRSGPIKVTLPPGFGGISAVPVNLRGEATGAPLPLDGDHFTFSLPAYAPASFVISREVSPVSFADWQSLHFEGTTDPEAAAGADPDGDGTSNMNEFLAGTDPLDSGSVLRTTEFNVESGSSTVSWKSVPGKIYQVEWCASLDESWSDSLPASRVLADSDVTIFTDPTIGDAPRRFYRIRTVVP
ncbi:hypothetical protein OKA05_04945 [Luteolibacter arcticus]|uniref:Glycoside hydrolase family 38 N-terminal domain-containing protein n=1 Tax=Luteolibacter arcticus TaxID=1581411 RepID=A0ABT3GE38_9BACT|nr:hypothetical protein [Luteolibacter arcticus]MCW1921887.1 hypothetical protein [Luteolibacter arcticus]